MLVEVHPTQLVQRCDFCGTQRSIAFDDLVAGVQDGDPPEPINPDIVVLPECTQCGAKEFLSRVQSSEPAGGPDVLEHRRAVNTVHATLVASGRVASTLAPYFATEAIDTEVTDLPWAFPFEPRPIVGQPTDPVATAFAAFLASRQGGG